MRLPKLLEVLTRTPLLMQPGAADSLLTLFHQHHLLSGEEFRAAREGVDQCGEAVELEQMEVRGALAVIPVKGPLGIDLGKFEKGAGATDYNDVMADVAKANQHPTVQSILLNMDTPGGMWGGLLECARAIEASEKPVYAFVPPGGTVASAGMYLAASCAGVFLSPSASAGSVGVYCAYTDLSELAAKKGIKVKVFSSGVYKGMGIPGTELSAAQEALLQDEVMELAEHFYGHMRNRRGDVSAECMQGQMFRAEDAVKLGFADNVVSGFAEVFTFLG